MGEAQQAVGKCNNHWKNWMYPLKLVDIQVQSAPFFGTGKAEGTLSVILLLFCPSNQ
jgi:hypothetical protein